MEKHKDDPYLKIPLWFIKLTSIKQSPHFLTPFERELYWCIRGLTVSNGITVKNPCYANDRYFANIFLVTIKHINKSIQKLESKKYLKIAHINNKRYLYPTLIEKETLIDNYTQIS